ncbi:hypothetical protein [Catenuloplanes japonicus]|uniref:hypothetical protein n=1 Tax=Catenuloplanes japonicus TaxID=33876 RepID=UPI0005254F72|nr:hypothetical protein [Catenuloplanes japonicus]
MTAPRWGWRAPGAGRASHVDAGTEFQGTTVQLAGLYPFVAGSGAPMLGVPIGRHLLSGETCCLDPLEWLRAGLVTNPGMFLLGQPGAGKSALAKRLITGMAGFGTRVLILGDTRPDYTRLVQHLGGQVIRVGRGLDRINPLDAGPLGVAVGRLPPREADRLRLEVRGRRLALLLALATLVRGTRITNTEEVLLGRSIDLLDTRLDRQPTVPDVLTVLREGPDQVRFAANHDQQAAGLVATLTLLCDGSLRGVLDGPTSTPIDLDAPAVSVDISQTTAAGDQLVAIAMLCTWAYAFGVVDAATALAAHGLAPRRQYLGVMDELWRALRGAPGLVDRADALTRLSRPLGMGTLMITHSLDDLAALPTAEDRAKAGGFFERAAIKILAALPGRELDRISAVVRLSAAERTLVSSWAAPEALVPGRAHPGRGKYLIKTGEGPGLPVGMRLVGDEPGLYDTDAAVRL